MLAVAGALLVGVPGAEAQESPTSRRNFVVGGMLGFADGLSLQGQFLARDLAPSIPVEARLRLGFTRLDPGSSSEARRIFINNATNGTPEKKGRVVDLDLDLLWPSESVPGDQGYWSVGVRHSRFRGNFRYVGGNEDFDVTSAHWGLGIGTESRFVIGSRTWLVVDAGLDWFPGARLQGHDTSYSPDGDDVNPREDYQYGDADDAINQPKWRPVLLIGVQRRLGG
ncbi:MAG: hypothetical protein KJO11_06780 [Gemmatimonadetes bacterium]|nr:hypothetical protein [Gemmatimonadota bacterium]MBT8404218.1 hypothetical protein [Gemmatimonadota bacterium]NNF37690.1 hypothetical protein [Gemmatimonadota bacterium]